jgi:hypothetical protein
MAAARFLSVLSAALLALAGCTQENSASSPDNPGSVSPDAPVSSPASGAPGPADDVPAPAAPTDCNADKASSFVGREATPKMRADLEKAVAPVRTIRWVGPGDATTEDYSPSRLNVMLDVGGTIRSAHCG